MRLRKRSRGFLWGLYVLLTTGLILFEQYATVAIIFLLALTLYLAVQLDYRPRRLSRYQRLRANGGRHTEAQWAALKRRYGYRCLACNQYTPDLEKDHIIPVAKGGTDHISNLQPLCRGCNASKGTKHIDYRQKGFTRWL